MTFPVIERAGDLLARYDVIFCDIWGVVHDGVTAYPGANEALPRFRAQGGTVVLVSNAPLPGDRVATLLDQRKVDRAAWDAIVSSGDLTRARLAETGAKRVHHVGPDRDLPLFEGTGVERVALEDAQALVVTGLVDDRRETADEYRPLLERALARRLPLVCANPDLVVEVGDAVLPCAGAIATLYEAAGGEVYWAGKPYAAAYRTAFATAARLRGAEVPPERVIAIGDAVRTDLAGAADAGVAALFVTGGIHREALTVDGRIDLDRLAALFGHATRTTVAAIPRLAW